MDAKRFAATMECMMRVNASFFRKPRVVVCIWIALFLAALCIDGPVARLLAPYRPTVKAWTFAEEIKEGGHAGSVAVIAIVLAVLHRDRWKAATLLVLSGLVVGVLRMMVAIAAGRVRPVVRIAPLEFHPFDPGPQGFLHAQNLSFTSGHASLAFASAAALAYLIPDGRKLFFAMALLVAIERVAESAHYTSDIVASARLGLLSFELALKIHRALWNRSDTSELDQLSSQPAAG